MDIPLACNISAIKAEERSLHKKNAEDIFGSVKEVKELSGGYAFQLPAKTKLIEQAGAFIARERLCCPFFHFALDISPDHGPVWLKLTGDNEIKQFVANNVVPQLDISVTD